MTPSTFPVDALKVDPSDTLELDNSITLSSNEEPTEEPTVSHSNEASFLSFSLSFLFHLTFQGHSSCCGSSSSSTEYLFFRKTQRMLSRFGATLNHSFQVSTPPSTSQSSRAAEEEVEEEEGNKEVLSIFDYRILIIFVQNQLIAEVLF